MTRATVILSNDRAREKAALWCMKLPVNTTVDFKENKRTVPQNDRMHAMLTDVARQKTHHGLKLDKDDWKLLFLDALNREMRVVPNLDGTGLVPLTRSSTLTVEEMSGLIDIIAEWGARNDVVFTDEQRRAA